MVHPTVGSLRVFKQFMWLEVGSVKMVLSRPAHPRVTPAVGAVELSGLEKCDWGHRAAYSLDPDGHVLAFAERIESESK